MDQIPLVLLATRCPLDAVCPVPPQPAAGLQELVLETNSLNGPAFALPESCRGVPPREAHFRTHGYLPLAACPNVAVVRGFIRAVLSKRYP